jgi:hypothetical protein
MGAPATHAAPQRLITEPDVRLAPVDRQRKQVQLRKDWWRYSQDDVSPLGRDHPALLIHRRAQQHANSCASAVLSHDMTMTDKYRQASALVHSDPDAAQALLREVRAMAKQGEALTQAYDTATQAHLATMLHLLAVAVSHKTQQVAVRKVAEALYGLAAQDQPERAEATQAPPDRQLFTHADAALMASADAGEAPPAVSLPHANREYHQVGAGGVN